MYKALSELFLNSLMVANTDSMRQEKTNRKLEDRGGVHQWLSLERLLTNTV